MKNTSGSAKRQGAEPRRAFLTADQVTFFADFNSFAHFDEKKYIKALRNNLGSKIINKIKIKMYFV
jgi:hypothetical protein